MGDHYIPQYYLSGFCEPSTPTVISRYEIGSRTVVTTAVKNVAQETGFYSPEVEQYLAEKVEGPANNVLKKIRNLEPISSEDKLVLSAYMVIMRMRVPQGKERLQRIAPEVAKSLHSELDEGKLDSELGQLIKDEPSEANRLEEMREKVRRFLEPYEQGAKEVPKVVWLSLMSPTTFPKAITVLNAMTWQFLISGSESAFLTSDNPVFFFESIGIGRPQSELSFPISRNISLWATWHRNAAEGFVSTSEKVVHQINRRTLNAATDYVFFSHKANWVSNFINNRKRHELHLIA